VSVPARPSVVGVRSFPTAISTQCRHCGEWSETELRDAAARITAFQLLLSTMPEIPTAALIPTVPEPREAA
jgi:hypothetical protein